MLSDEKLLEIYQSALVLREGWQIFAGLRAVSEAAVKDSSSRYAASAEEYLRSRYGAYKAHHEWRSLEDAFKAGAIHSSRAVAEAAVKDAAGGEPVAWARNLADPRPDTVTDLIYCSVAEHERGDTSRYIPLYTRPQASAAVPEGFYIASFKRLCGYVTWWMPNDAGYTTYLEQAGIYTADQIAAHPGYYDNDYTVPIPVGAVSGHTVTVIDQGHSANRGFWDAKSLRAMLAASQPEVKS